MGHHKRVTTGLVLFLLGVVVLMEMSTVARQQPAMIQRLLRDTDSRQEEEEEEEKYHISPQRFTLTEEEGPSIESLQNQLQQCSLALGMRKETLEKRAGALNTIATNLSLYLTAIHSIVPRHFSPVYTSPCWESRLPAPSAEQKKVLGSLAHTNMSRQGKKRERLYRELLVPAVSRRKTLLYCLPSFFLAGFPKSGTTTLHRALSRHRAVATPSEKEPHWWTRMPLDNEDQNYLRLATLHYLLYFSGEANHNIKKNPRLLVYDGSQSTLWDSNFSVDNQDHCAMAAAVSHILPTAKFVVVMREPVSRTYSHYVYSCTWNGRRPPGAIQFHEEAVSAVNRLSSCLNNGSSLFECVSDRHFSMAHAKKCGRLDYRLPISLYHLHLSKWLQFFPRDNFLFLRLEDLSREPNRFMGRVTQFLSIADLKPTSTRWLRSHRENQQKSHAAMLPETRALLSEFFRPFNEKLVELTGDKRFLWSDVH